mgnify:CR=1 FL=1
MFGKITILQWKLCYKIKAIKNFQKEEGLTIDGIAGNEVWRKIDILMLNKMIEDD